MMYGELGRMSIELIIHRIRKYLGSVFIGKRTLLNGTECKRIDTINIFLIRNAF